MSQIAVRVEAVWSIRLLGFRSLSAPVAACRQDDLSALHASAPKQPCSCLDRADVRHESPRPAGPRCLADLWFGLSQSEPTVLRGDARNPAPWRRSDLVRRIPS